jgi:hypothetical protein
MAFVTGSAIMWAGTRHRDRANHGPATKVELA